MLVDQFGTLDPNPRRNFQVVEISAHVVPLVPLVPEMSKQHSHVV